jgi:hypothetical protein
MYFSAHARKGELAPIQWAWLCVSLGIYPLHFPYTFEKMDTVIACRLK